MSPRNEQSGVALIAVLCLIVTGGMLVAAISMISQLSTVSVTASVDLLRSRYVAEGCANRILFLIEADRDTYGVPDGLTETDYSEYEHDRFLPDGVEHEIDYYGTPVKFRILNGSSGLPMQSNYANSLALFIPGESPPYALEEKVNNLTALIGDYIDTDDNISDDGQEKGGYDDRNMNNLPRNATPEFREELLWIPDITDILPLDEFGRWSLVQLPGINSNNIDFYTAPYSLLRRYADLDENKTALVLNARERWRRERVTFADQLDAELLQTLRNNFSWAGTNYYTILVERAAEPGRASSRLAYTFQIGGVTGPDDGIIRYVEWMSF
jgi:hypothetical protein